MASHPSAIHLASILPVCDKEAESDYISLCDIVITGVETGWSHFVVEGYNPDAEGSETNPWAILHPLPRDWDADAVPSSVKLSAQVIRDAVEAYIDTRIAGGMSISEAAKMVDGSYTDAVIADSILQFAIYHEDVYS